MSLYPAKPPGRSFKLRSTDLFSLIEWQADNVAKNMDSKEAEYFVADKDAGKKHVKTDRDRKGEALVRDI